MLVLWVSEQLTEDNVQSHTPTQIGACVTFLPPFSVVSRFMGKVLNKIPNAAAPFELWKRDFTHVREMLHICVCPVINSYGSVQLSCDLFNIMRIQCFG